MPQDRNRAAPPTEFTHVLIPLDPHDDDVPGAECVWAEPVGDDRYRIANVPFFAHDVGLHDVVLALEVDDHLELVEVVERRRVASFSYELGSWVDTAVFFAEARGAGAATERLAERCYTSNLHHPAGADAFERLLEGRCRWFERFDHTGRLVREFDDGPCR